MADGPYWFCAPMLQLIFQITDMIVCRFAPHWFIMSKLLSIIPVHVWLKVVACTPNWLSSCYGFSFSTVNRKSLYKKEIRNKNLLLTGRWWDPSWILYCNTHFGRPVRSTNRYKAPNIQNTKNVTTFVPKDRSMELILIWENLFKVSFLNETW